MKPQQLIDKLMRTLKTRLGVYPRNLTTGTWIHHSTTFVGLDQLELGRYVYVGARGFINCKGGVSIGDGTAISSFVQILSEDHQFRDSDQMPFNQQMRYAKVEIGKGAWIGIGAIILPGVRVGEGGIVAAGSVVTRDVEAGTIVGGNPARRIGQRDDDQWREAIRSESYYMRYRNL